tara:strand:- start:222 stop:635 length:414 start_codon:yes stop_codon:yes gene_type:complete
MEFKDLEKAIGNINKKHQPSSREEVFQYLNEQLENLGLEGEVSSILVYDTFRGKINCYGGYLPASTIHNQLNLTAGTNGANLTGHITYSNLGSLSSYKRGYFIPISLFQPNDSKDYIALINIPVDHSATLENAVKFP